MLVCPRCCATEAIVKKGVYIRRSDQRRVQRYLCRKCGRQFSDQCFAIDYRQRRRSINQVVFRLLCKGMSQRAVAFVVGVKPETVACRMVRFGQVARQHLAWQRLNNGQYGHILFDELESFEHTKCKPLTVPIAVTAGRRVLALSVGQIAAKGHLAKIARKKYGQRHCERGRCLDELMVNLKPCTLATATITTDQSVHYPQRIKQAFPAATHLAYKGRRGCVVGQGELKEGGFDPLFSLNHTYAMFRDNLKRLTRRTWCTTKRPDRLELLMHLYAYFHNEVLDNPRRVVLKRSPVPI